MDHSCRSDCRGAGGIAAPADEALARTRREWAGGPRERAVAGEIAVYKDQGEINADVARGLIGADEAENARRARLGRRILAYEQIGKDVAPGASIVGRQGGSTPSPAWCRFWGDRHVSRARSAWNAGAAARFGCDCRATTRHRSTISSPGRGASESQPERRTGLDVRAPAWTSECSAMRMRRRLMATSRGRWQDAPAACGLCRRRP